MLKQTLRSSLQAVYSESDLKKWFDPLMVSENHNGSFGIHFPHALFAEWITNEKRRILEQELAQIAGHAVSITYHTPCRSTAPKKLLSLGQGINFFSPLIYEGKDTYCFNTFIYNKKNEFPLAMAKEVSRAFTNKTYFPFIICGKGTCGKTHLLRATAKTMAENPKSGRIYLGGVDDLVTAYSSAGNANLARQQLLRYDSFFLDDSQRLTAHPALQQELIYVTDHFLDHKKPLVLTFDDLPAKTDISEKLRSRLEAGLVVVLKKPDLDVRLRYLLNEAKRLALPLSKAHALAIAQRFHDIRKLSGVITKITAFCSKTTRTLTDADLEKLFGSDAEYPVSLITPEIIIKTVAEYFSLPASSILSDKRCRNLVQARQISMFLCRELLGLSFPALGIVFGGKNHATVVYGYKKIQLLQNTDSNMNNFVSAIKKKCLSYQE